MTPAEITRETESGSKLGILTGQEIRDLLGELMDSKVAAILRVEATRDDLESLLRRKWPQQTIGPEIDRFQANPVAPGSVA